MRMFLLGTSPKMFEHWGRKGARRLRKGWRGNKYINWRSRWQRLHMMRHLAMLAVYLSPLTV
jgi:hypothetical protein